jgi:hypothetical protein
MNANKLVHVANQLGQFYAAVPDAVEAPALAPLVREPLQQACPDWAHAPE